MSDDLKNIPPQPNGEFDDDEKNLVELLETIWDGRMLIVDITGLFTIVAVVITLLMPNKYAASLTILPDTDQRGMGQFAQLSGLASMAGIDVGGASEEAMLSEVTVPRVDTSSERKYAEVYRIGIPDEYWEIRDNSGGLVLKDFDQGLHPEFHKQLRREQIVL